MSTKTVSQLDAAGFFFCPTEADEDPRVAGAWLMPSGTVDAMPPGEFDAAGVFVPAWPEDKWPRWTGAGWSMVNRPQAQPEAAQPQDDPIAKLQAFLVANPDVAAIINNSGQPANV